MVISNQTNPYRRLWTEEAALEDGHMLYRNTEHISNSSNKISALTDNVTAWEQL